MSDMEKMRTVVIEVRVPKAAARRVHEDQNLKVTSGPFAENRRARRVEIEGRVPPEWLGMVKIKEYLKSR